MTNQFRDRRVRPGHIAIAAAAAFALTGGAVAASTAPPAEGSAGAASGDPVVIAVLGDETGVAFQPSFAALDAAVAAINADGGINGHPIELAKTDTKSDVATAQAAAAEIPDDAIAVLLNSAITEASIADSLSALGIPVLGVGYNPSVWGGNLSIFGVTCATSPDNCANENFFTTSTTIEGSIAAQLLGAMNVGASTVTSVACAEVDSCSAADPIFQAIGESLGLTMVPSVKVSTTAADYSAECVGFVQDGVEFIQISGSMGVNLIASCLDQGYEGTFGASGGSVTAELLGTGAPLAGGLNGFPWFVDAPPVNEYRQIMEDAGLTTDDYGWAHATAMYAALKLIVKAAGDYADPAAPLDGAAMLAAMYQVTDESLDGLLASPRTFSADDLDRTQPCFWPYIQDAEGNIDSAVGGLGSQCFPDESAAASSEAPAAPASTG